VNEVRKWTTPWSDCVISHTPRAQSGTSAASNSTEPILITVHKTSTQSTTDCLLLLLLLLLLLTAGCHAHAAT